MPTDAHAYLDVGIFVRRTLLLSFPPVEILIAGKYDYIVADSSLLISALERVSARYKLLPSK